MINILNIKNFIMSRGNTLKYHYFYKITNNIKWSFLLWRT